jgi:hypothetical protein
MPDSRSITGAPLRRFPLRPILASLIVIAATACAREPVQPRANAAAFTGEWRSMTRAMEFIRLSVHQTPNQPGALDARLTFSGVQLEGTGDIDADSMVANLSSSPTSSYLHAFVARRQGDMLLAKVTSEPGLLEITFVRD